MNEINQVSLGTRIIARFYDGLIVTIISVISLYIITEEFNINWVNTVVWDIFYALYLTIVPVFWTGYVIGKRINNIKILRYKDNNEVTFFNMFMREFVGFHIIGIITLGLSLIASLFMVMFRQDKRAIHDIVSGTYVVHN